MNPTIELLRAIMDAVALHARDPSGGEEWNRSLVRIEEALDAALAERADRPSRPAGTLDFKIHGDELILGTQPVWELRGWAWIERLTRSGVRGFSLSAPIARSQLEQFLVDLESVLAGEPPPPSFDPTERWGGFGLQFESGPGRSGRFPGREQAASRDVPLPEAAGTGVGPGVEHRASGESGADEADPFPGDEELAIADWILGQVGELRPLPVAEAEALVRIVSLGIRSRPLAAIRLLQAPTPEDYPAAHAVNTALLTMLVAEQRGETSRRVWELGLAGLLHDVGMTQLPRDLPDRSGALTPVEREILESHPAVGARILFEGPGELAIPVVVAYEHHVRVDGGGYPRSRPSGPPHPASRLVHLTSVYDALRASRPYSPAWEHERALAFLRAGAGGQFDRSLLTNFLQVIEGWHPPLRPPGGGEGEPDGGPAERR